MTPCLAHPITLDSGEAARERLHRSGDTILRRVQCDVHDGELILSGCLPSHDLKQVAQAAVADVEGIHAIVNRIEVVRATGEAACRFEDPVPWHHAHARN